jgi:hypothetical protein
MLSLHPLLADMPDPSSYQALGWIIVGVFCIVGMANQGVDLWRKMFPKEMPPAHELYATKLELAKLEKSHKEEMARIEKRFSEWMSQGETQHQESMEKVERAIGKFGDWQLSMERALGHVETKADYGPKRPR